ncbi:hypothetical protein PV325_005049 [Microctonus aethiopoides]|uniref:Small ribosomal subunit protein mS39 n=1 Tax=Microctonus aethiopoides TaxID=144406 RepID=A0AA39FNF6_9HYME|nr:hypothetical protein PV325_005049 [Microctonus aethiopoides]KAK0172847.1 hypothetical protein PV328_006114 [Microctonus aethiopoides]
MNSLGRQISNRRLIVQSFITRLESTENNAGSNIRIPIKKVRGPTDILRAIERTIKYDPTAPRYKYHDDPYLIPFSNASKRNFALAQESGRKAAMWIREQHKQLFQHRVADPIIESYLPKAIYTKKEDVNENILKNAIIDGHVTDALTIYKLLNEEISIETKQSLLELLCYYNNAQPLSEELLEENWYRKVEKNLTWKNCSETETLFTFLKRQDNKIAAYAYNAMICATAKYTKIDRTWQLFKEAEEQKIPLCLRTYNHLISTIPIIKESSQDRRELLTEILDKMESANIQPNTGTMNAALKVAASIYQAPIAQDICRSLFTEFKRVGIRPSLTSYYYALIIFYRKGEQISALLEEILNEIEGQEFNISDKIDTHFFILAMDIAANILQNPMIGDRIHKLLLTGKNYDFLSEGHKESIYYRHYFMLQVKNQTIDEFVKSYYDVMVPHIYTPEPGVMDAILDGVAANDPEISTTLLPRFWTHIVLFGFLERKNLIGKSLHLMRTHCKPVVDSPINKMFGDAAWTVWDFVMAEREKRIQTINWNGHMLGDIAVLLLRANEFEKCANIISYLYNEQNSIVEVPHMSQIEELLEACILRADSETAMDLVHYCSDSGIENIPTMAYKVWRNLSLTEEQETRLRSFVSPDVLKTQTKDTHKLMKL